MAHHLDSYSAKVKYKCIGIKLRFVRDNRQRKLLILSILCESEDIYKVRSGLGLPRKNPDQNFHISALYIDAIYSYDYHTNSCICNLQ